MNIPIEIVNMILSYISSPTSLLIKESIYYNEICLIRYLNYNGDGLNEEVRDDYFAFYNAYLQCEFCVIDLYQCIDEPCPKLDIENIYSYIYRYIFQGGSQQKLSTMWISFISRYNEEKMNILQNYLKLYPVVK